MIGAFGSRLGQTLRDGLRLWWLAPLIPLISAIPEMAQHVAEIQLGMFLGGEATRAAADDPLRWAYGYAKIAGLLVAMIFAARFWATRGTDLPWWSPKGIVWPALVGSIAAQAAVTVIMVSIKPLVGAPMGTVIELLVSIATLPLFVWMMGSLLGDRRMTLARSYTHGWGAVIRIALLSLIPFGIGQVVHIGNHMLAMGAPAPAVWVLMVWDSFVVGTMAAWMGTALHHGYLPLRGQGEPLEPSPA